MKDLFDGLNPNPQEAEANVEAQGILMRVSNGYQVGQILQTTAQGWLDPKDTYIALRMLRDVCDNAMQILGEQAKDELQGLPTGETHAFGEYEAQVRNSAGRWKYTDDEYVALKKRMKQMEELRKQAHKLAQQDSYVVDQETGEVVPPAEYTEGKEVIYLTRRKV